MPSALPTGAASLDAVAAYVDQVRLTPVLRDTLVDLLREQAPVYSGRGTNEAERLRGYVLASFEATGLPPAAIPYVLEELESGRNPYTVAAAAAALRGAEGLPGDALRFLLAAIDRIRAADDVVSFETFALRQHRETSTTALQEIFRTLAWLGPLARPVLGDLKALLANSASSFSQPVCEELERAIDTISHAPPSSAPCCAQAALTPHIAEALSGVSLRDVELQDQAGTVITFAEAFFGRPSVLAFFYTRCMNPEKCSLTVTRLARVQRRLKDEGLGDRTNVAGITYDPAFDHPERLRAYGTDRGMAFDERNRLLRTTGPFEPLQRCFDLGVGYGPVTVNRHRLDLVVLDDTGCVAASTKRRLWHEDDVLRSLKAAAGGPSSAD